MFTYSGDPSSSDLDQVRFLLSDTNQDSPLLQDEEIQWLLDEGADVYDSAANGADIVSGKFAHNSDYSKSVGDLSLSQNFSAQAERFKQLGTTLRQVRFRKAVPTWVVNEAALVSTANRNVDTYNTDAYVGQFDNPQAKSAYGNE